MFIETASSLRLEAFLLIQTDLPNQEISDLTLFFLLEQAVSITVHSFKKPF